MQKNISFRIFSTALFFILGWSPITVSQAADQIETYQKIREYNPYFMSEKDRLYASSDYEYSWITIGSQKLPWRTLTNLLLYPTGRYTPYLIVTHHDRSRAQDMTLNFGSYMRFEKSTLRLEQGFGLNPDFIYKYQMVSSYEHQIYKGLNAGYTVNYQHRDSGDTFISSPGLTYYFGSHYVSASYNTSVIESRGGGHFGSAQFNFIIHPRVQLYGGSSIGQRLFDISGAEHASKQSGFILFGGFKIRIFDRLEGIIGYSYSEEKPNFIKRSINSGFTLKF